MSDDIHALSGAYAVDALDDVERAQFERHLAACSACQNEVSSLREAAAMLAEATRLTAPAGLRDRVLVGIATVRPLPPLIATQGTHRSEATFAARDDQSDVVIARRAAHRGEHADDSNEHATVTELAPRRRRRAAAFLAAAAAVAAIGAGGVVWHSVSGDGQQTSVAAQVIAAPDHETYTKQLDNGATATVYRSEKLNEAVLVTSNMPAAPTNAQYVLWLQHDGTLVPAGVMPDQRNNTVVLSGDVATATATGITQEKAGPEPTTPSGNLIGNIAFQET